MDLPVMYQAVINDVLIYGRITIDVDEIPETHESILALDDKARDAIEKNPENKIGLLKVYAWVVSV